MRRRFSSGSLTPASRSRNCALASTTRRSMPRCRRKVASTCSRSCSRSSPWSTKMQVSRSPTARCTSTAATDESTPPDSPQITRWSGPTSSRIRSISLSTKWPGVQSGRDAADLEQEIVEDLAAPGRVRHLGMELHAEQRPLGVLERGHRAVVARRGDRDSPAAATSTWSPWLIQTGVSSPCPKPRNSRPPSTVDARSAVLAAVGPRSRCRRRDGPGAACRSTARAPASPARAAPGRRWGRSRRTPSWARRTG